MAARGSIHATLFLSFTILPLLTFAVFPFAGSTRGILFPGHDPDPGPAHHHHHHIIGFPNMNTDNVDSSLPMFLKPDKTKGDDENDGEHEHEENEKEKKKKPIISGGYGGPVPEIKKPDEGKEGSNEHGPGPEEGRVDGPGPEEPRVDGPGNGANAQRGAGLRDGFYEKSCPQAEDVVRKVVKKIFHKDPTLAPSLIRLFLHDCFVTGCDASILLDRTPTGEEVEKKAQPNGPFVRGYEAIDEIKARLETECPGIVSCADVLAFTTRDALVHVGVPSYNVAAGRRDGLASLSKNVRGNLPNPDTPLKEVLRTFQRKGFSMEDLVVLTGAHSIGTAHCTVVSGRFFDPKKSKEMDQGYLTKMRLLVMCRNDTQELPFDPYSHHKMDSRYYKELLEKRALIESDHNLAKDEHAKDIMKKLVGDQKGWLEKFTKAMVKLGGVEVLTGDQGQIRKQCRSVN